MLLPVIAIVTCGGGHPGQQMIGNRCRGASDPGPSIPIHPLFLATGRPLLCLRDILCRPLSFSFFSPCQTYYCLHCEQLICNRCALSSVRACSSLFALLQSVSDSKPPETLISATCDYATGDAAKRLRRHIYAYDYPRHTYSIHTLTIHLDRGSLAVGWT